MVCMPFPYKNLSQRKQPPALIVSNDNYTLDDVVLCAIKSKFLRDELNLN